MQSRRWSAFKEFLSLPDLELPWRSMLYGDFASLDENWAPSSQSFVRGLNLIMKLEVPGADPSRLEVLVNDREITVHGECRRADASDKGKFCLEDCPHAVFQRTMSIPPHSLVDQISAIYNKDALEIIIPQTQLVSATRRIEVAETT